MPDVLSLRRTLERISRQQMQPARAVISLDAPLDRRLPAGGLACNALHEIAGTRLGTEHAAAATLFVAGVLARTQGAVVWVMEGSDLFAPALAGVGLSPDRTIFVEAGRKVLAAMEEGLQERGLAGVVGETSTPISLMASRRLSLAAEKAGTPAFLLRRSRCFDDPRLSQPISAATRWRIAALPSGPPLSHAPTVPGLARAQWRLDLVRCRGGEPASWIVEACDATGHLGLVSDIRDRSAATGRSAAAEERPLRYRRA